MRAPWRGWLTASAAVAGLVWAMPHSSAVAQPASTGTETTASVAAVDAGSAPPANPAAGFVAAGPGANTAKADDEPPLWQLGAVDLARVPWFASAELQPSASAQDVVRAGIPTTPTVTVRTGAGQTGTLFAIIDIPATPPSDAELTIGDIDGQDEAFFNGQPIGATRGFGITDKGIPRVYRVAKDQMRQGPNVLALRVVPMGASESFSIRRRPLTFGFVPVVPPARAPRPEDSRGGTPAIPEPEGRAAANSVLPRGVTGVQRKRPSFGRFGNFLHDGLPAVSEISPTMLANRGGPVLQVALDSVRKADLAGAPDAPAISSWQKLARVEATCNRQPVTYTMLTHAFYPGGIVTLEQGTALEFTVQFTSGKGVLHALTEAEAAAIFKRAPGPGFAAFAIYESKNDATPLVIATDGCSANATQSDTAIELTIGRAARATRPARLYAFFPAGIRRVDLSDATASFLDVVQRTVPGVDPLETARHWMRVGLNQPGDVDEYFAVDEPANTVHIAQVVRFTKPTDVAVGTPLLPIPPQVSMARAKYNYAVQHDATTPTGVMTFSGELQAIESTSSLSGASASSARAGASATTSLYAYHYTLPLPSLAERGLLALPGNDDLKALLNSHLTDLPSTSSVGGVDAFYKSRTQGFHAFSYLNGDNRRRLLENTANILPAALGDRRWVRTREPLSGLAFWWTYFIEGPFSDRFDQDWGNGLSLYGFATAVKYTGAWELAARVWPDIENMFSWFTTTDDWEWMRASNAIHGHGTGAGDCANATYAAAVAYARLAKGCGRTDEAAYGQYTAARNAVFLMNRFVVGEFARDQGLSGRESLPIGYHEGRGYLAGELNGYPWNATSMISGNGVQPENFDLYMAHIRGPLEEYEKLFDTSYPDWRDPNYDYRRNTIYRGNSGYITLPHIYLRARTGMDSAETLAGMLQRAKSNTYLWWLAPTVVAEVLNDGNEAIVTDWGRAAFLGGEIASEKKNTQRLTANFDNKYAPDTVEFTLPRRAQTLEINDGPVPLTDWKMDGRVVRVRMRKPGPNTVRIVY